MSSAPSDGWERGQLSSVPGPNDFQILAQCDHLNPTASKIEILNSIGEGIESVRSQAATRGGELHRPRICAVFKFQGKSGVQEGRKGRSEQSAQVAIWTDGSNAALSALLILSCSFCMRAHGQAALAMF
eukprot:839088-Pelagomonas_calceolata.AAC.3